MWPSVTSKFTQVAFILCLLIVLVHVVGGADDEALRHLLSGNELAGKGRHLEAIEATALISRI